ncbi:unnamed protein product [Blepharisma stoltei]|uniref:Uncharacterized protein n=1 Tax=Blepharisma stoltei TaxID=1481888 RepID=A0AAU9KKF4_9CILI|nr:unnamed protein product [Blepharisma stoltei]
MEKRISLSLNFFPTEFEDVFYMSRKVPNLKALPKYLYLAWFEYLIFYFPERVENTINILNSHQYSWINLIQNILLTRDCNKLDNLSARQDFFDSLRSYYFLKNKTTSDLLLSLSKLFKLKIIKIRQNQNLIISIYGNPSWSSLFLFVDRNTNYSILYPFYDKIDFLNNWIDRFPSNYPGMIECVCLKNHNLCKCSQLIRSLSSSSAVKKNSEESKQEFSILPAEKQFQEKSPRKYEDQKDLPDNQYAMHDRKTKILNLSRNPSKMYENRVEMNQMLAKNKSPERQQGSINELTKKECGHEKPLFKNFCGCLLCRSCSHNYIIERTCKICNDSYLLKDRNERADRFLELNNIKKLECEICTKPKNPSLLIFLLPEMCKVCRSIPCINKHIGKCNSCKKYYVEPW